MYQKHYFKKRELKKELKELKDDNGKDKYRLEKEVIFLRDKLMWEKTDIAVQTDIDLFNFKKMEKNHEIVVFQKRLTQNKLSGFIEKIKYSYSKHKPISRKSLLNLIPEFYNEKIDLDNKLELEGKRKIIMDEFFYNYMSEKFKLNKIIKKNCEQSIMSILKFSNEDSRIDLFRRFLGIGDDKIRREILDNYLIILKNLPISFFKIFDDDYKSYLMNTEQCFEILYSKFPFFEFVINHKDVIINLTQVIEGENEVPGIPLIKKFNIFLLTRMYNRSMLFINEIATELKRDNNAEILFDKVVDCFLISNKEFDLNETMILDIFQNNFDLHKNILNKNIISVQSFLKFFSKKYFFKIKIVDFLEISLNALINTYGTLEKKIIKFFDEVDFLKKGFILYKEFEQILIQWFGNNENKWKISEFFKDAVGSGDKEFLIKEEFITFCLNTKEIYTMLLNYTKNKNI